MSKTSYRKIVAIPKGVRQTIWSLVASDLSSDEIITKLWEDYNTKIDADDLEVIKDDPNAQLAIRELRLQYGTEPDVTKSDLLKKSITLLNKRLTRAMKDADTKAVYDSELNRGMISEEEHKQKTAGLYEMPTADILKVSAQLEKQISGDNGNASLPNTDGTSENVSASSSNPELAAAIANGDAIEIQRLLFKK